jgi:hypothetical protein
MSRIALAALLLAAAGSSPSPPPAPSPSPTPAPCTAQEYRQFDFWLGNWDVIDPSGKLAGTNRITREFDGCVLQEHWVAAGPPVQRGSSFNTWSSGRRRWHQTWVDSTGGFLLLDGELKDSVMTLTGEMPGSAGGLVRHRISWSRPDADKDDVRQFWEASRDAGKTWNVVFDGRYVRRKATGG